MYISCSLERPWESLPSKTDALRVIIKLYQYYSRRLPVRELTVKDGRREGERLFIYYLTLIWI